MNIDLSKYSAFLFDLDGTLLKGSDIHLQESVERTARELWKTSGVIIPRGLSLTAFLAFTFPEKIEAQRLEFLKYNKRILQSTDHNVSLYDDAQRFLENDAYAQKRALATNCMQFELDMTCSIVPLSQYFSVFSYRKDDGSLLPKPAPDIFLYAAKELGVDPKNCLVFEDSMAGIEGAKYAGMDTVAIDRFGDLPKGIADFYVNSFDDLI